MLCLCGFPWFAEGPSLSLFDILHMDVYICRMSRREHAHRKV